MLRNRLPGRVLPASLFGAFCMAFILYAIAYGIVHPDYLILVTALVLVGPGVYMCTLVYRNYKLTGAPAAAGQSTPPGGRGAHPRPVLWPVIVLGLVVIAGSVVRLVTRHFSAGALVSVAVVVAAYLLILGRQITALRSQQTN